jgi:uncharacterized repeat protein (TIGR01451 family)
MAFPRRKVRRPARLSFDEIMKNVSIRIWKQARIAAVVGLASVIAAAHGAETNTMPAAVAAQIAALSLEKQNRTPAQRKLDSQLIYARRMSQNQPVAPGVVTQRLDFVVDAQGRVLVDITAKVTDALLAQIGQLGGQVLSSVARFDAVRARMPLAQVETLAGLADVKSIRRADKAKTNLGRLVTEGDATHRAGVARTNFNVGGNGVKIGVISDSVDFLAGSQASGDLGNVTILPGQDGVPGSGEGTAMLEIVADLAPKSQLYFASAFGSIAQFAQNILDLRAAGCDIIVDDVIYFREGPFQDDIVARAVNSVVADGAMYFSSAGNAGNKNDGTSATWEGDFVAGSTITAGSYSGVAHSYGTTIFNAIDRFPGLAWLFWSDPLAGSTNDYDLFVVDLTTSLVVASSTDIQSGTQDPVEAAGSAFPGEALVITSRAGAAAPRFLHLEAILGELTISTDGFIRGHAAAAEAFAVGAVDVATSFPNPFTGGAANPVEDFSSDGPRRVFYDPSGNPLTPGNFLASGGVVRPKPEIAAADGVKTTTPGFNPFFGTSAAAPHAAAIAALLKSYNPRATPQQIRFALTNTALDIEAPGFDRDSGWGIIMPAAALQRIPAPLPTLASSNLSGGNLNGIIDVNECNELDLLVRNDAISAVTAVSGSLSTLTPGVTVVQSTSLYPTIPANATVANLTPYRIYTAPTFACGTPIDFVFIINSSAGRVTNSFRMNTGVVGFVPASFTNNLVTDIPEGGTNYLDIPIAVSNLFGFVGKVRVSAHVAHPRDGDLTLQLIGPDGTTVTLSRQRGGTDPNYGLSCAEPTIFDDAGTTNIVAAFAPFAGIYAPEQSLTAFSGKSGAGVNGTWLLRVTDSFTSNTGRVQCVTLSMFPAQCADGGGDCSADLAVSMTDAPDPVLTGSNLVYTIVVTNLTARTAPVATLADTLPPGMTVVGITSTRGSCSSAGGSVSCAFGTLPPNGGAMVRITVRPTLAGTATNTVSVTSLSADPNSFNNVAVVTTTVQTPRPIIVPFSSHLVFESGLPANGALDPGETVTINFAFRNVGSVDATNLNAKLIQGGGVTTIFTNKVDYGPVVAGGAAVSRPFAFTAGGTNGGVINVMFQLRDGTNDLGLATFSFGIVGQSAFANQRVIDIRTTNQNTAGPAFPYPSTINVAGLSGLVANVTVTLSNLTHSFPEDLDILLVGPGINSPKIRLMSDAGSSYSISSPIRLIFDDNAATAVPQSAQIVAGTYRPTNYTPEGELANDSFINPAPAGPYGTALAAFRGQNPNGVWSLFIFDDAVGDAGRIANGWSLSFDIIDPINPRLDLAVTVTDSPDPVKLNSNVTYTITVTNAGPEVSPAVQLTNLLSGGLAFVSVTNSQGVCTNDSGTILCDLGAINASNGASVVIVATAVALTSQTLTATVGDEVVEFNYDNNSAVAGTAVSAAADVGVSVASAPNPAIVNTAVNYLITVTNRGPNTASAVRLTNLLASGVTFTLATPSQGSCTPSASDVVCALGSIASGSFATVEISVNTPDAVRVLTNQVSAFPTTPSDPNPADNVVSTITTNYNPAFIIVASTALLVSESGPISGGIDPGETVAINFYLRNVGTTPTANLTASIVSSPSVVAPGAAQDYGVLVPNGASVGRTNSFTANGTNGELITVTLLVQDGAIDLGYVDFTFPLGNQVAYQQTNVLTVPAFGPASVYPSTIIVSNLTGTVSRVVVTLTNLSHTYPDDLDILLVSPSNRVVLLLSDVGGATPVTDLTLILDDAAAENLPNAAGLFPGVFKPTNFDDSESDEFPAPAPSGPYATSLAVFNDIDPNGVWALYVHDGGFLDAGQLGGWSLNITTVGRVQPEPAVLSASTFQPAGQFQLRVKGEAGGSYCIEASTNLLQWTPISTNVLTSGTLFFNDPMASGRVQRFYRALRLR